MTNVRMRDTFMKVGQSLLVKRQLGMEKQLKEKMIHSVMPPKVADWLMKGGVDDEEDDMDIDSETGQYFCDNRRQWIRNSYLKVQ